MRLKQGDIVQQFKRGRRYSSDLTHCYLILNDNVIFTENEERCVVYQALYNNFKVFCRPYSSFMSEVDKKIYPETEQTYRLEKVIDPVLLEKCNEVVKTLR